MSIQKPSLTEIAESTDAYRTARSEPIVQEPVPGKMDFIRSLVLDIPIQVRQEPPMNIESMLEAALDADVKNQEKASDPRDHVSFDVPLLIRILEHAREGIESDVELHHMVERIVSLKGKGVLDMSDYEVIAGGDIEGTDKEHAPQMYVGRQQGESIDSLRKLAGIR
jgi:hypothetical protein